MIELFTRPGYEKYGLSVGASTGKFLFVGAMALDIEKLARVAEADTVENEVRYCLNRVEQRLQGQGLTRRAIVKVSAYITDEAYRETLFACVKEFFAPGPYPAMFAVVAGIAAQCRVEFEVMAATTIEFLAPADTAQPAGIAHSGGAVAQGYLFAAVNAVDAGTRRRAPAAATVADETRLCLARLRAVLAERKLALRDLVKVNAYLAQDGDRNEFWDAYKKVFEAGPYPARCTYVAGLAADCRVQLDAVAVCPPPPAAPWFLRSNLAAGVSPGVATDHLVYASALAIDIATMKRLPEARTVADETRLVIRRLESVLAEAGCTLRDIAKTTCFVRDEAYRFEFIHAYKECFDPGPYPSRATYSLGLAGDCRVQIDAIAILPTKS